MSTQKKDNKKEIESSRVYQSNKRIYMYVYIYISQLILIVERRVFMCCEKNPRNIKLCPGFNF